MAPKNKHLDVRSQVQDDERQKKGWVWDEVTGEVEGKLK
jgi:hypothetical protein